MMFAGLLRNGLTPSEQTEIAKREDALQAWNGYETNVGAPALTLISVSTLFPMIINKHNLRCTKNYISGLFTS